MRPSAANYSMALMIKGVGIDLIETERFKAAMRRQGDRLLARLFTEGERRYCEGKMNRIGHYAARFAVKEAVLKALGTGWRGGIAWTDVEVVPAALGKVEAKLTGLALKAARKLGAKRVHISISHAQRYACAVAVLDG